MHWLYAASIHLLSLEHFDSRLVQPSQILDLFRVMFSTGQPMQNLHLGDSPKKGFSYRQILEFRCQLESNPGFTANVLVACAGAAFRLSKEGHKGAFTMLDIPPRYLSPHSLETLRKSFM
nr:hypothetical protein BSM_15160 [uncultured archaeon]CBH38470.1 hypothetical protein BSM_19470 [uncultured archaeon]